MKQEQYIHELAVAGGEIRFICDKHAIPVVRALLRRNASFSVKNIRGLTSCDACKQEEEAMRAALVEAGVKGAISAAGLARVLRRINRAVLNR